VCASIVDKVPYAGVTTGSLLDGAPAGWCSCRGQRREVLGGLIGEYDAWSGGEAPTA
jgi:hypothetical protein